MRILILLFGFCSSLSLAAEEGEVQRVSFHLQTGLDVRVENTVNPELKQVLPAGTLGFFLLYDRFGVLQELAYSKSTSSSGMVNISAQSLEWNQWAHYLIKKDRTFMPYVGVGLGLSQTEVKTAVSGASRKDKSHIYVNGALSGGLLMRVSPRVDLSGELRVWKFEQKKDPTFSGLFAVRYSL